MGGTEGAPVRIGIDGFNLALPRGTGVATYGRELARCLHGMGHPVDILYGLPASRSSDPLVAETSFFEVLAEHAPYRAPPWPSVAWLRERRACRRGLDARVVPMAGFVDRRGLAAKLPHVAGRVLNCHNMFDRAARHFRRSGEFLRVRLPDPPAVMHWTYPVPVSVDGARNVYTVHDLVPLRLPHTTLDNKGYHINLIRGCLRGDRQICTVSEDSRRDIETLFPEAAGRVTNTYEAFEPPAAIVAQTEHTIADRLGRLFGLAHRGYFLFFGSIEPKKNIGRLIEAFLASGTRTPLVIVGAQAWKSEGELRLLKAREGRTLRPDEPAIVQHEYLPLDMLMTLVRGARAVLFPSLTEGFGLPLLEAMSLGTPVMTSTGGSLPEIAGDAALLIDPYDTDGMAAAIGRLDTDPALRAALAERGPVQAARFGMARYAERLAGFHATLLS